VTSLRPVPKRALLFPFISDLSILKSKKDKRCWTKRKQILLKFNLLLSITHKYVHFSYFVRIYKYLCFVTFSYALLMRLHKHRFPSLILEYPSFLGRMIFLYLFSMYIFTKWSNTISVGQKMMYKI
jgi:hypothetical protein